MSRESQERRGKQGGAVMKALLEPKVEATLALTMHGSTEARVAALLTCAHADADPLW